ncbi:capsule biosynthesis protein [Roseovarius sp. LXJ103]|uniref:capsule biosynthesis protein n=1 Tax=Roseovarius carneus TaxID=2853164 RepID=UPI000D60694A|nr:capsule biosynthesis protein [Roseovarius carneus]MBZ8118247.1 capsule biosynthesis protein [Roseovarius carneus]PWE36032.1 capsule biosynthesis protein [Pelagicola sp. LXJ1103]
MTTKPKARKFRIKRSAPHDGAANYAQGGSVSRGAATRAPAPDEAPPAGQPPRAVAPAPAPAAREGQVSSANEMAASATLDEIRHEGLTGRQLRMARRVAQKHGLAPTSDFDAVRLLRAKGIDPFQRASILELVTPTDGRPAVQTPRTEIDPLLVQLPETLPFGVPNLPAVEMSPAAKRSEEITRIQKDIGSRRRKKLVLLLTRLLAFVMLPTLVAGWYYYVVATPMYSTKSEFLILSADGGGGGGGGLGGLLPSQFATGQDAIATQSYLLSKDAMLRLDSDVGFRDHFSQPWIDPIQRLDADASNEEAFKLYKKNVKIGYDPTEGVLRMEVATADPAVSANFSEKLIEYAEERVDELSQEKRQDAVQVAIAGLDDAKFERREAQRRLVEMQEGSVLDPQGEIGNIRSLISNVELQLQEKQLGLNIQLNNARPNAARVEALQSEIAVLSAELARQNARLTQATGDTTSLASQTANIQMAQADLATADLVLQSALENKRQSTIEANKQVRYLTVSVRPVASQDASYPRAFENTILAFLIFAGIYLMLSLTASILREQVTS